MGKLKEHYDEFLFNQEIEQYTDEEYYYENWLAEKEAYEAELEYSYQ
jgi:hypothetical protein